MLKCSERIVPSPHLGPQTWTKKGGTFVLQEKCFLFFYKVRSTIWLRIGNGEKQSFTNCGRLKWPRKWPKMGCKCRMLYLKCLEHLLDSFLQHVTELWAHWGITTMALRVLNMVSEVWIRFLALNGPKWRKWTHNTVFCLFGAEI